MWCPLLLYDAASMLGGTLLGNVVKFGQRRPQQPRSSRRRFSAGGFGIPVIILAGCGGYLALDQLSPSSPQATPVSQTLKFAMCGRERITCVVDGDTIWLEGQNLRLASYDTPEPYDGICGGAAEVALAKKASARLLQLLNGNAISVETFGLDNTGKRTLATIRINGQDVGDILIEEKLARRWPDGEEWWCAPN
jgi:endonuclease YncB( thermonuclease family)